MEALHYHQADALRIYTLNICQDLCVLYTDKG